MIKLFAFVLLYALLSPGAQSGCGDNVCGLGEDTLYCPQDCPQLKKQSQESVVGPGPAVRGVAYKDGMAVTSVINDKTKSILQFTVYDSSLKRVMSRDILFRENSGGALGNPQPLISPGGDIYVAFRDHDYGTRSTAKYKLRLVKSRDGGRTWDFVNDDDLLGQIDVSQHGLWEPFLFFDAKGLLRVVYAKERGDKVCPAHKGVKQDIVSRVSHDSGKTWSDERVVASEGVSRDGVPFVTKLSDGSFLLVFESWQSSACGNANPNLLIRSMRSADGVIWSKRDVVFDPYTHANGRALATWPSISLLKDGRALVSFTSNFRSVSSDSVLDGRPEEVKNYDVFVMASTGGAGLEKLSWDENSRAIAYEYAETERQSNRYASSVVLSDGRVVVFSGMPARFVVMELERKVQ